MSEKYDSCPVCGVGPLIRRQCKLICEACGYAESCEDLFTSMQDNEPPQAAEKGSGR